MQNCLQVIGVPGLCLLSQRIVVTPLSSGTCSYERARNLLALHYNPSRQEEENERGGEA